MDATLVSLAAALIFYVYDAIWLNKPGANTKTVVFKFKFCVKPIRQGSHELKAQPSICRRIEICRETDAVVRH
jgi:hypothetical protein